MSRLSNQLFYITRKANIYSPSSMVLTCKKYISRTEDTTSRYPRLDIGFFFSWSCLLNVDYFDLFDSFLFSFKRNWLVEFLNYFARNKVHTRNLLKIDLISVWPSFFQRWKVVRFKIYYWFLPCIYMRALLTRTIALSSTLTTRLLCVAGLDQFLTAAHCDTLPFLFSSHISCLSCWWIALSSFTISFQTCVDFSMNSLLILCDWFPSGQLRSK